MERKKQRQDLLHFFFYNYLQKPPKNKKTTLYLHILTVLTSRGSRKENSPRRKIYFRFKKVHKIIQKHISRISQRTFFVVSFLKTFFSVNVFLYTNFLIQSFLCYMNGRQKVEKIHIHFYLQNMRRFSIPLETLDTLKQK